MVPTEVKLWFLSSLEYFWPDPWDTLIKVALFFEKMHKVFKNKVQRYSTPLSTTKLQTFIEKIHSTGDLWPREENGRVRDYPNYFW